MSDRFLEEDVQLLGASDAFAPFAESTVLVTGATGLIGSLFVKGLAAWNDSHDQQVNVIALARSKDKAQRVLADCLARGDVKLVVGDVTNLPDIPDDIDWISHGASVTSSAAFASKPVEVALTEIEGTRAILELAREKNVRGCVYLSSLEVYGDIPRDHGDVREGDAGVLDRFVPRNSYPASKQMCEALCAGYAHEYGLNVRIARLAQTFGAGVAADDARVFASFARAVVEGAPIVLHTPGEGCRCYCYTTDAVEALAVILAKGNRGEAYNVATPSTYCSVREMAEMVVARYAESGVSLEFDMPDDISRFGFAAPSFVKLNSDKLQALGWSPRFDLPEMYDRLIGSMNCSAF